MLAEAYTHLKEEYPSHGLEIVFVSSDRDSASFQQYFASMPWLAVPFEMGAIPQIKARFGVRGIPALIVLDAMSGNIVVPASDSRREVMQACQRGDDGIEDMLESWIARTPQESQEILAMLELSCADDNDGDAKDKNGNDKEHPYLVKSVDTPASPAKDTAAMVKEAFAKLVAQGVEPNVAAAKAIQLVAEQQKSGGTSSSLEPGPLNEIEWKLVETTSASSPKDFTSIVTNLNEFNKDATEQVISTALKYLQNARKEPWTPKFRSFKLSNKIVDRITRFEGALDLLYSLGLYMYPTESDFMLCIPLSADLDVMEGEWKKLLPATESSPKED